MAWNGFFYVFSNEDAPRGRIFRVDPAAPDRSRWATLISEPERNGVIKGAWLLGGRLVLQVLRDASTQLEIWTLDGKRGAD
jgi:prolyl oligopeptidase